MAGFGQNPCTRFGQWFVDTGHVVAIGVQQYVGIEHDADMAFPEHQIIALQLCIAVNGMAEGAFLHVAVARTCHGAGLQGQLHEAGAIHAKG